MLTQIAFHWRLKTITTNNNRYPEILSASGIANGQWTVGKRQCLCGGCHDKLEWKMFWQLCFLGKVTDYEGWD
jgi:hypothetical protein